jgi:hypothetical protein
MCSAKGRKPSQKKIRDGGDLTPLRTFQILIAFAEASLPASKPIHEH